MTYVPLRAETVRRTLALGSTVLALLALSWLPTGADEPTSRHDDGLRSALPDTFALTGAKIVVDPSTVIDSGTLVVSRGKIVAVGADAVIPPGARTIDASGRTLLAAPIDPYAPVAVTTDPADNATYWNEQIRPERRAVVGLRPDAAADAAWRAQGFAARNFAPDAGVLRGYGALLLLDDAPVDRRVLAADATQHALLTLSARGARGSYPSSPMGAYALARQAMYDAQWYAEARRIAEVDPSVERPEYNRSLEALGGVLDRSVPLVVETSNDAFVLRADRYAREFGLTLIVVGSGNEYRRVDEIAATGRALILPVDFPGPPDVATAERAAQTSLESLMHWDLAPENPARLHAAGVRFALTGNGLSDPKQFWPNLRKAIERGLPASTALAALTVVPAEMLGVADQVGTLHPGKVANFIVCDGSPLESEAKLIETWVAGSRFEIAPVAERRAEGRWQLEFSGGLPTAVIALTGDDASLKGAWERPHVPSPAIEGSEGAAETAKPEPIRFRQIGIGDWRVAGLVPGEALQQQGTLQLTLTIRPEAPDTAVGSLVDAAGVRYEIAAKKLPAEEPAPSEASAAPAGDTTNETAAPDAAAPDTAGAESNSATPTDPAAPSPSTDADADAGRRGERDAAPRRALYEPNFPLGDYGVAGPPVAPAAILFRNATVWTCGPEGILAGADVLVTDGTIAAVGIGLTAPEGATVIDATGMHLTPGIIDCHSHMGTDGGVNEGGQAITAEVRIGDFVDASDITIYRQLAGGVTAANVLHGSANPIGGQNQVIKLRWGSSSEGLKFAEAPAGIKFALGENVKQSNAGDSFNTRYPQTRMGVQQIMRDAFLAARHYRNQRIDWERDRRGLPPRRDLELDAIVEILEGRRWIHCHSYRQDEILALLGTLDEFQITIGSLQHILEGYKVAEAIKRHGGTASAFSDWWAYKVEVSDAIPYAGALMHEMGIVVSFNSDDDELARHLNQEAAKAVRYGGVDPAEALKFVTLNPAKQLRIDRWVGSIEPGKQADLVLWSGDPLSNLSRCEQTWIEGRKYFDRAEDLAKRAEFEAMRTALVQRVLESGETPERPGARRPDPATLWPRHDEYCAAHDHARCLQQEAIERAWREEERRRAEAMFDEADAAETNAGSATMTEGAER